MDRVGVSNLALTKIGVTTRLTDPAQDVHAAREIAVVWDLTRRLVLRILRPSFAKTRAALSPSTTLPKYEWDRQFPLPDDYLRLIEKDDVQLPTNSFAIEGRAILANTTGLVNIRYIRDVTDFNLWDDASIDAFAARLGFAVADPLSADKERKAAAWSEWTKAEKTASGIDAVENPPAEQVESSWIDVRWQL